MALLTLRAIGLAAALGAGLLVLVGLRRILRAWREHRDPSAIVDGTFSGYLVERRERIETGARRGRRESYVAYRPSFAYRAPDGSTVEAADPRTHFFRRHAEGDRLRVRVFADGRPPRIDGFFPLYFESALPLMFGLVLAAALVAARGLLGDLPLSLEGAALEAERGGVDLLASETAAELRGAGRWIGLALAAVAIWVVVALGLIARREKRNRSVQPGSPDTP